MIICHPVIQPSLHHPGYLLGVVFPWPVICLFGVVLTVRLACQALGGTEEGGKNVNIEGRKSVMKKWFYMLLVVSLLIAMAACGAEKTENMDDPPESQIAEPSVSEWTRAGYFGDENENMLSVIYMDDIVQPGWYVGCMLGEDFEEDSWGGTLPQVGDALQGALPSSGNQKDLNVTITEDGEDGLLLTVEGGEQYHFTPVDLAEAMIVVNINTEGAGMINYAEGEETPEIDPEWPYQSAYIGLDEPKLHTFAAAPEAGSVFVKWTKNGEDYSTEPVITLLLEESADYVAVFEEDPGWQNPVMNFVGEYQCDRAHATVACMGTDEAWITIEWGGSASELARWDIVGRLDLDTLTIPYSGVSKMIVTYDENGEIVNQEPEYEDGTGTIVFHNDGTFTWHEDQSEYGNEMLFEWLPVTESGE